jgi:hypothetical protein
MNGMGNLELFRRFYLEYPQLLLGANSDAVRRKSVRSVISETASRKSGKTDEERTIRKFRIVALAAALGFKSDFSRWNLP